MEWGDKSHFTASFHPFPPQVAGMENMFEFEHILSPKRSAVPHSELHNKLTKEEGVSQSDTLTAALGASVTPFTRTICVVSWYTYHLVSVCLCVCV